MITLGRNAKASNVLAAPEMLAQREVEVFECDRGGDVTFHGPGQLVAYPIFDLRGFPSESPARNTLGVIEFVRRLEEVLIRTCADFGIPAKRIAGLTGVWTGEDARRTRLPVPLADVAGTAVLARPAESKTQQPIPRSQDCRSRSPYLARSHVAWPRAEREHRSEFFQPDCSVRHYIQASYIHAERAWPRYLHAGCRSRSFAATSARYFAARFSGSIVWMRCWQTISGCRCSRRIIFASFAERKIQFVPELKPGVLLVLPVLISEFFF